MDNSRNRPGDHLGVNKMGKNIRKSPLHQPNFPSSSIANTFSQPNRPQSQPQPQPQPQIYNISKNDFRSIVQQLTGSPSHDSFARPNPPKQSVRLQKIRPPPLSPMNRPHIPAPIQQPPVFLPPVAPVDAPSNTIAESPISAYMRILQSSITDIGPRGDANAAAQMHPAPMPGQQSIPNSPSFQNGPPLLSPSSQFLMPSHTAFMNLLSPRSPYPLFSPGIQFPPPLSPNFSFSPFGSGPQAPPSPGLLFPLSPNGFFTYSPKWREP